MRNTRNGGPARLALVALAAAWFLTSSAPGTWSIVIVDRSTGDVAVGCATCLTEFDLAQGTPVIVAGQGAASAQSAVDAGGFNRTFLRDAILDRHLVTSASTILTNVRAGDTNANSRQYGIALRSLPNTGIAHATYTGPLAGAHASGVSGQTARYTYAVQGNVLTGSPVVNAAVAAITSSTFDLPETLMNAMEAARAMGGDGRCSCTSGTPTSCGSPPPAPFKSAHVGYMIIARRHDRDGGVAAYRTGTTPLGLALGNTDANSSIDIVVVNTTSNTATSLLGRPELSPGYSRVQPLPSVGFTGGPRAVVLHDANNDGREDVFVAAASAGTVMGRVTQVGGVIASTGATAGVGATPVALAAVNVSGDASKEIVCASFGAGSVSVIPVTATPTAITFGAVATTPVGGQPIALAGLDLDGDNDNDIAVVDQSGSRVVILANASGVLTPGPIVGVGAGPVGIAKADFDGDSDDDLVVACQSDQSVFVLTNTGGAFTSQRIALPFLPVKVRTGDVNNDGAPDIVVAGSARFGVLRNASGAFPSLWLTDNITGFLVPAWTDFQLGDMDQDSDLDIVATHNSTPGGVSIIENMGRSDTPHLRGTFTPRVGQAAGDYYMHLNVAYADESDPDPVLTLREQFDSWRIGLAGVADAYESDAELSSLTIMPQCERTSLRVTLRDRTGNPVTGDPGVVVTHAPSSASVTSIGVATHLGQGVYEATITLPAPPTSLAHDEFRIVVPGTRPVVLLRQPILVVSPHATNDIDFNNDGLFPDTLDLDALLSVFAGGECVCYPGDPCNNCDDIDFNNDGIFPDIEDLDSFVRVMSGAPC